mmetsp:Transcript_37614/g.78793  ORF Transcript_37614/g.78793 Transcript_37614/m.78793 type:complete len:232 (-) Transcript_37614:175-870(-)|eukprot:CAMPEP_0196147316 /NCGR_PEP_ID=MMETSP0910-20130528/25149_1 /TAXON_ID=49265 /ORGANISM="Thalassiosira rotula, Strain GSO102" /LENGTH=231 /DNA_ID=CAMNT_0041409705 /DNA_START=72 /DNA_END=767 /DNA_ORIENTATION=-
MTTSSSILPSIDESVPLTTLDLLLLATFLPLWLTVYYGAVHSPTTGTPEGFDSSTFISNLHSVPLCILAFLSLQEVISESVPLWWSVSFFVVDLVDTIVRRDVMFAVHAVISLMLNLLGGASARHRVLRSLSKGFFTEASTPFLNHWKKSKSYTSFLLLFLVFTSCRMIWVPYFLYNTYAIHLKGEYDFVFYPSVLFYILQCLWYGKMCLMVVNYRMPKEVKERLDKMKEQ